ncbi:UdgX family uracil-DNA binding protein [Kibdelosporangium philippinense]|uniref:Type-4 uracil-DNA glycosylase n=1 Tax=Kibdelosporangium philippinense TaxID=211113 RepID=A0ABS8ZTE9_9PSEU|nr:UdgX family uracil-DNA binding protein [Kibdelosporangium philippinense]MCE7010952.1 UdgX family uracil-DNA binding protein [Kibdelosporangium philippinense]
MKSLSKLRSEAGECHNCDLYKDATQTVFGEGPARARVMMIGETPGDQEDKAGKVFVGPAGRLLDRALADAGIDRSALYLTNAVKHFKFTERGKRRIHQTPNRTEVVACQPWLLGELAAVKPELVVCLGSVAAKSLLGSSFKVTQHRGEIMDLPDSTAKVTATVHPSAVLRADNREEAYREFVKDLSTVSALGITP